MRRGKQVVSVFAAGMTPGSESGPVMRLTRRELIDVTRQQGIVFSRHDIRGGKAQLNPAAIHAILQSGFSSSLHHSHAVSPELPAANVHDAAIQAVRSNSNPAGVRRVADDTLELPPLKATYSKPIGPQLPTKRQWRKMAYETVYVDLADLVPQAEAVPEESNLRRIGKAAMTGLLLAAYAAGPIVAATKTYDQGESADTYRQVLYGTYNDAIETGVSLLPDTVREFYQR